MKVCTHDAVFKFKYDKIANEVEEKVEYKLYLLKFDRQAGAATSEVQLTRPNIPAMLTTEQVKTTKGKQGGAAAGETTEYASLITDPFWKLASICGNSEHAIRSC